MATLAVYLTGGYHSSFFVLYLAVIIGVAYQLELLRTMAVTLVIGLIYVGACYVNPAGLQFSFAQYILAGKVLLLLVVALLCGLLLEQLRREQQQTAQEREQVARLRALDKLQENFVLSVSHELKTPLTCIRTAVDLLSANCDGPAAARAELIDTIDHHVRRLQVLVDDLLEITKLDAGQITLVPQRTDLHQLVSRVVETLRPLALHKGQVVQLHGPESPCLVEVDRKRMEQVLTNVLSNAITFTPKQGHIDVHVLAAAEGFQVSVVDDGPGIPLEAQPHLFEKFYVAVDGRGLSGMGLGLYIARQIVELHGGHIWVESRVGGGSTFRFTVPAELGETAS
jgi:signal transduction histidine kinase